MKLPNLFKKKEKKLTAHQKRLIQDYTDGKVLKVGDIKDE